MIASGRPVAIHPPGDVVSGCFRERDNDPIREIEVSVSDMLAEDPDEFARLPRPRRTEDPE